MKVVSSWPNYAANMIFAVTEDGEVWGLPMLDDGRAIADRWIRMAPWITRETKP